MAMPSCPLVVVGASAGGVPALMQLTAALPADFAAAMLVVLHVGDHPSVLPTLLARHCPLDVAHARQDEVLRPGCIRIAPPDFHLLVDGDRTVLSHGPKEHYTRPAIDPLFRSAALAAGPAVIGVVLTGTLDDGTAGLQAIKQCGGVAVVQDPADALEPSMPRSALAHVAVDHCVPLALMPVLLASLATTPKEPAMAASADRLRHEQDLTLYRGNAIEHLTAIGRPSPFVCPDCTGGLWELLDSRPQRYRCHTGHAYTLETLREAQSITADGAAWTALRALQEKRMLLQHMAQIRRDEGDEPGAASLEATAGLIERQAAVLRGLLEESTDPAG